MAAEILHRPKRLPRRRFGLAAGLGTGGLLLGLAGVFTSQVVLLNRTPSEPPGLYARTGQGIAVGRIIAFRVPALGRAYVDQALPVLRHRSLLKAVAAGPGDRVCEGEGILVINGRPWAPVVARDHLGRPLPHWQGCRALTADEVFVFSDRVPNSFDSRYFGPVSRQAVLGVYQLVAPLRDGAA